MRRLLAAVLLVLVASPLTAPFSIGDPLDLFGGVAEHLHAKTPVGDPAAHVTSAVPLPARTWDSASVGAGALRAAAIPHPVRDLPLRL